MEIEIKTERRRQRERDRERQRERERERERVCVCLYSPGIILSWVWEVPGTYSNEPINTQAFMAF